MSKLQITTTTLTDENSKPIRATGVLLMGGLSRRMGKDKLSLMLGGQTLAHRGVDVLHTCFDEVLVSIRPGQSEVIQTFETSISKPTLIEDLIPHKGPLGALYASLQTAAHDWIFLAACDMPCFSSDSIHKLARFLPQIHDKNPSCTCEPSFTQMIVARTHETYQMLHGFYHRSLLPIVHKHLVHNRLRLSDLIPECNAHVVEWQREASCFKNINTPQEWEEFLSEIKK